MATSFKGYGEMHPGNWQEGLANIDEAAAAATSGQLNLRVASDIYCNTIAACRNMGDLKRAGQWADEGERWMRRNGAGGYPGICRVHRAELKMLRGQWSEAEQEARQACDELQRFGLIERLGYAQYEIGEVRLRMGDLEGARGLRACLRVRRTTRSPGSPSCSWRAASSTTPADRSIERWPRPPAAAGPPIRRPAGACCRPRWTSPWPPGDLDAARIAVEELESIAADFERPLFQAGR